MFSLIITIISIALVIALALAVMYYGGDTSSKAATRAVANTIINQAAQINAAGTIATAQGPGWPSAAPIFAQPYVTAMPVPPKTAYIDGIAAPSVQDWEYYSADPSTRHFVLRNKIRRDVCMAVNKEMGFEGIPAAWDGKTLIQCFGTGTTVAGAYTFFYDPIGTTAGEKAVVIDKSLAEGGTTTPGYPRLCADGTTIDAGLCPSNNSVSEGDEWDVPPMDGGPISPGGDDSGGGTGEPLPYEGEAPTPEECAENPTMPTCDVTRYSALKIQYMFSSRPVLFTAIRNCSEAEGATCLPNFRSQQRTWEWAMPDGVSKEYQEYATDGRLGEKSVQAKGFSISDGSNTYTVSSHRESGMRWEYVDIQEYPTYTMPERGSRLIVNCLAVKEDIERKGGEFFANNCSHIETGYDHSWTYVHSGGFNSAMPRDANPGWTTNFQNWGALDTHDISDTHMRMHAPSDIGTHAFKVGGYYEFYNENQPLSVKNGIVDSWPMAPLQTNVSNGGY